MTVLTSSTPTSRRIACTGVACLALVLFAACSGTITIQTRARSFNGGGRQLMTRTSMAVPVRPEAP